MNINPSIENAYKVLDGKELSRDEAVELTRAVGADDLLDLISLANKVRKKFGPAFTACSIINARAGRCSQDCKFCAQSGRHLTQIETYPLVSSETALEAAKKVYDQGVRTFGYVTSGRGWTAPDDEFQRVLDAVDLILESLPGMKVCASLGILSEECVALLAKHGVWRYNMNIQTNPARYSELIATTHTIEEKIETIRLMQKYGITNCTGGIIGLGETWEDRIDMAFALKELDVDGINLNVLLPIKGTPLENLPIMSPADVAKTAALFRLVNPTKSVKFCAGRETTMKDFQGLLMLSGLDSVITGGYLTTRGREVSDDDAFIDRLRDF